MPTLTEVRAHRQVVADLAVLAERDIRDFLRSLGIDDPRRVAQAVREFVPEVVATYTAASSTIAADWYEDLRYEAAVGTAFTATVLDSPDADAVQEAIGYALVPLFKDDPTPDAAATNLAGLATSIIGAADRQTVEANTALDGSGPRYARHASASACTFCRMLATRGAGYRSEESASRVILRRASREIGEKYHDHCHCTVVPVWNPNAYEEAPYVADWREAYYSATEALGGASDTSAILSRMRQTLGTTH